MLLPHPVGPTSATVLFAGTANVMSSTANGPPSTYLRETDSNSMSPGLGASAPDVSSALSASRM